MKRDEIEEEWNEVFSKYNKTYPDTMNYIENASEYNEIQWNIMKYVKQQTLTYAEIP